MTKSARCRTRLHHLPLRPHRLLQRIRLLRQGMTAAGLLVALDDGLRRLPPETASGTAPLLCFSASSTSNSSVGLLAGADVVHQRHPVIAAGCPRRRTPQISGSWPPAYYPQCKSPISSKKEAARLFPAPERPEMIRISMLIHPLQSDDLDLRLQRDAGLLQYTAAAPAGSAPPCRRRWRRPG